MNKYREYLKDNLSIIVEKIQEVKKEKRDNFTHGELFAVITLFKEQAEIFHIDLKDMGLDDYHENDIITTNHE